MSTSNEFVIDDFDPVDGGELGDIQLDLLQPEESTNQKGFPEDNTNLEKDKDQGLFGTVKVVEFEGHTVYLESLDVKKSWKLRLQVLTTFISFLVIGLLEQTIGSVLHYLLEDYQVDRVQISYLFLFQFTGYLVASFSSGYIHSKIGFYGFYLGSLGFAILTCVVFGSRPPLICLKIVAIFAGLSNGGQDCGVNAFICQLKYSNEIMGIVHSCYGIGCFITPILVTYLIHQGWTWNQYYYLILVAVSIAFVMALVLFKEETKWKYLYQVQKGHEESEEVHEVTTWSCLKNKYLQFFSIVLFIYVGGELAIGTWIYNYLLTIKKVQDTQASYITASYWAAMTSGRIALGFFSGRYFEDVEYKAIVMYAGLVSVGTFGFFALQNVLYGQVTFLCLVGIFIGPMFSTTVIVSMKTLPKALGTAGVGIISGLGGTGAAVIPWVIGWISENFGDGSDGGGLVYFPLVLFITFTATFILWLGFYFYRRKALNVEFKQKYVPLSTDIE